LSKDNTGANASSTPAVKTSSTPLERATFVVAALAFVCSVGSLVFTNIERNDRQAEARNAEAEALNAKVRALSPRIDTRDLQHLAENPATPPDVRDKIIFGMAGKVQEISSSPAESYSYFSEGVPAEARYAAGSLKELLRKYPRKVGLENVDLRGMSWEALEIGNKSRLRGVDLRAANLSRSRFDKVDLRAADLRCANLSNARFTGASKLEEAELRWADLRGADLRGTRGLTAGQLEDVTYDSTTRWPSDLVNLTDVRPSATDYERNDKCADKHLRETGQVRIQRLTPSDAER